MTADRRQSAVSAASSHPVTEVVGHIGWLPQKLAGRPGAAAGIRANCRHRALTSKQACSRGGGQARRVHPFTHSPLAGRAPAAWPPRASSVLVQGSTTLCLEKSCERLWCSSFRHNRSGTATTWLPLTSTACQEPMRQGVPITFFAFSWPVIFARDLMITLSAYLSSILQERRAGDQPCDQGGTPMPAGILAGRMSLVKSPRSLPYKHKQQEECRHSASAQPACPACMASATPAGLAAGWGVQLLRLPFNRCHSPGSTLSRSGAAHPWRRHRFAPMQASTQHQHTTVSFTLMRTCHS